MHILIPTPLRAYTAQQASVPVEATTVQDGLEKLVAAHPELKKQIFNEDGKLRAFVNLYLNEDDVRYLTEKEYTAVKADDELSIIPSIAGGCWPHGQRRLRRTDAVSASGCGARDARGRATLKTGDLA